jgi:hypothetical protein
MLGSSAALRLVQPPARIRQLVIPAANGREALSYPQSSSRYNRRRRSAHEAGSCRNLLRPGLVDVLQDTP